MSQTSKTFYYRKLAIHTHRPEKRIKCFDPIAQTLKNDFLNKIKNMVMADHLIMVKKKQKRSKILSEQRKESLTSSTKGKKSPNPERSLSTRKNAYHKNSSIWELMKNKKDQQINEQKLLQENPFYKIQKRRSTSSYSFSTFTADIPITKSQKMPQFETNVKMKIQTPSGRYKQRNQHFKTDSQNNEKQLENGQVMECRQKSQTKVYEDLKSYFENKYCKKVL